MQPRLYAASLIRTITANGLLCMTSCDWRGHGTPSLDNNSSH
jgi:hypothetical protein